MSNQEDFPAENILNKEELLRLIQEKIVATWRDIDALIEQHQNPDSPSEPASQTVDSGQKLYLHWKKGGLEEEV